MSSHPSTCLFFLKLDQDSSEQLCEGQSDFQLSKGTETLIAAF
jgi:hypothetical protein